MRTISFYKKMMLLSLSMGATLMNAQTGDAFLELFPSSVPGTTAAHLTELREEKSATYTASWTRTIDQLWYGDATAPNKVTDIPGAPSDNYNSRVRGYFFVAEAGTYKFQLGSDDGAIFAVNLNGADANPDLMTVVTSNSGYQGSWGNETVKDPGHTFNPGVYAYCITHNEGSGGDFVKVGVSFDGGTTYVVGTAESKLTLSQTAESLVVASLITLPTAAQQGQTVIFHGIKLIVEQSSLNIAGLSLPVTGTAQPGADITAYSVYFNSSAPSLAGATLLGSTATLTGGAIVLAGLDVEIPAETTGYLLLTAQVAEGATLSRTIGGGDIGNLYAAITTAAGSQAIYDPPSLAQGTLVTIVQKTDAQSKIEAATFSYPQNIDYKNYTAAWLNIGKFTLTDTGSDGKPTTIISTTVELEGWENIASIGLSLDGSTVSDETQVISKNSVIATHTLSANSGTAKDFYLAVKFRNIVTDRAVIGAKIIEAVADAFNSQLAADGLDNAQTAQSGDGNKIQVVATKLNFQTQPSATGIYGIALTRQPVVQSVDVNGSVDTDVNGKTVTLSNSASAVMANNTATLTNGTATFSGFTINHPQTVTVTASADGLTSVTSDDIVLVSNVRSYDYWWPGFTHDPVGQGQANVIMGRIVYESQATADSPVTIDGFIFSKGNSTDISDIECASIGYGGKIFKSGGANQDGQFTVMVEDGITFNSVGNKEIPFMIDVYSNATPDNTVDLILDAMVIGGVTIPARANDNTRTRKVQAPMSGEYYIDLNATEDLFSGGGRYFTSFTDAVTQINQRGAVAPGVTFIISDDQLFDNEGPGGRFGLQLRNLSNPEAPVVFRRSGDGTDRPHIRVRITTDYYAKMMSIQNCRYLTFDGLYIEGFWASDGDPKEEEMGGIVIGTDQFPSNDLIFQNCKFKINAVRNDRSSGRAIRYIPNLEDGYARNNGMILSNSKFIDNEFENCVMGLELDNLDNVEITGNTFTGFSAGALSISNVKNVTVSGNTIKDVNKTVHTGGGADQFYGVRATGITENVVISNNFIYNLKTQVADGNANIIGINVALNTGAANNTISNNMIWDLDAPKTTRTSNPVIRGINVSGSGTVNVYNNSIYLTSVLENSGKNAVAFFSDANASLLLKNNLFVNKSSSAGRVAVLEIPIGRLQDGSDNNLYYANNGNVAGTTYINSNGNVITFENYKTAAGANKEQNSVSADINFMLGANALNVANDASRDAVVGKGIAIAGLTTDIWGITRNPSPTIGAWEKPPVRQLTITGGISNPAGPNVDEGSIITITANAPQEGKAFDKWVTTTATLADPSQPTTTFKVPGNNVDITATYKDIIYTVGVTGGGYADPAEAIFTQTVTLTAPDRTGKTFSEWTSDDMDDFLLLSSATDKVVTFSMPSHNVEFKSVYNNIIYDIALTNATGPATAIYQEEVTIIADAPAQGKVFDKWTGGDDFLTEVERATSDLTFSMPAKSISLTATYTDAVYYLILGGATSDKPDGAKFGETVVLTANEADEGWRFVRWDGEDVGLIANINNPTANITMPDRDVYIEAVFEEIVYAITVNGGTANFDTAPAGERVRITASEAPDGKIFGRWASDDVEFDDPFAETTRFDMPAKDVTITVEWWNIGLDDTNAGEIILFPNPAKNHIQVSGLAESSAYTIINAAGQIIASGSDYNGETIDISSLPAGTYFFNSGEINKTFIKK